MDDDPLWDCSLKPWDWFVLAAWSAAIAGAIVGVVALVRAAM